MSGLKQLTLIFLAALAADTVVAHEDNRGRSDSRADRIGGHFDKKADRLEQRLDNKGARINDRLERKSMRAARPARQPGRNQAGWHPLNHRGKAYKGASHDSHSGYCPDNRYATARHGSGHNSR